jgi:hypothetical protein
VSAACAWTEVNSPKVTSRGIVSKVEIAIPMVLHMQNYPLDYGVVGDCYDTTLRFVIYKNIHKLLLINDFLKNLFVMMSYSNALSYIITAFRPRNRFGQPEEIGSNRTTGG